MIEDMPVTEAIDRIIKLNDGISSFWSQATGWAPISAAELLGKSRLDWQVSLSQSLRIWLRSPPDTLSDGELILAWTNLGALIEGSLKTFLSVWYESYIADIDTLKKLKAYDITKDIVHDPDGLKLEKLRQYFVKAKLLSDEEADLVELVQKRRNAVHAFKDKPIGDDTELQSAILQYLQLLRRLNASMPYPGDVYAPREA